ncbi:hypothetical protein [Amycolatopsis keratiniphila]|uniref:Uncharacterized protein n=1 Tax=Amycolatopsis keratiniphila TaxID=129921 RepID=R4T3F2_9PSEU|nr:hypothetical protein [Amycolatopsis keratiniphila]AGM10139.1 hypothetical protein AORI_7557 [Amycolatopsis keratiniphila]
MIRPGFRQETCVVAACGDCGHEFSNSEDLGCELHFRTVQEATTALTDSGWKVTADGVQCDECATAQQCRENGHRWPLCWRACACGCAKGEPMLPDHDTPRESRHCLICQTREERPRQLVKEAR